MLDNTFSGNIAVQVISSNGHLEKARSFGKAAGKMQAEIELGGLVPGS